MYNLLPILMMVVSALAGIVLFRAGMYGSGLYWTAAAVINFAVIYGIKWWG
jgi:hypothetical protein